MRDPHISSLVDGFLLGALQPNDDERVRVHILDCAACAEVLAEVRPAIDALAESAPPAAVPAVMRDRLLAAARLPEPSVLNTFGERPRALGVPAWALAAAACVVVAVTGGLGVWVAVVSNRLDDRDVQVAAARQAAAAFAASGRTLRMESDYAGHDINAAIAVPAEGQEITVVISGLPPAADGHGYRLWLLMDDGEPASLELAPDADGNAVARVSIDLSRFDEMELDAQPLDATAPGGELVIGGRLR